jgi:hypothetical protein
MSLTLTIPENADRLPTHRIIDLCQYLTVKVLQPFFARNQVAWKKPSKDFFSPDGGTDPFEPSGTINFYPPALFAGQLGELETLIKKELARMKIKLGPFQRENHRVRRAVRVVRILIKENPTWDSGPPEVNLSTTAGSLVLRDILGFPQVNGTFQFTADEALKRIPTVTEEQIRKAALRPNRDPNAANRPRPMPSAMIIKRIQRALDELHRFAQWAKVHKFKNLIAN